MLDSLMAKEVEPVPENTRVRSRVLIVDDEQTLRDVWQDVLLEEGYDVETAESPEHAMVMLDSGEFDLVLLDEVFKTGPFNGLDTYRKIRSLYVSIPVIMMTGYSDAEENITQAIREGAFRQVIKKPSTIAEITGIVSNCLLESSRNRQNKS